MSAPINPKAGEIWRVQLEPVRGSEQGKTRPVVVMSQPPNGRATIRLCAPIMHLKPEHKVMAWCAEILPDAQNGLTKLSTADAGQTRALDLSRFEARLGQVTEDELESVTMALCLCVGRQTVGR